jgi:cytosine deaminase
VQLLKVKTARFTEVVATCGAPEVVTLWVDPKEDKSFQGALREERIMTVHQTVVGSKKDFGEVGFIRGGNVAHLLFPKSLKHYAGRRIVGIDYRLLSQPKAAGPLAPSAHKSARKTQTPRSTKTTRKSGASIPTEKSRPTVRKAKAKRPGTARHRHLADQALPKSGAPETPAALDPFMLAAIKEARKSLTQGGIPIGAALVREGKLIAVGHNQRVQKGDPVAHAETDCLHNAGRIGSFRGCTLYSTLMPCFFCAGAAVQFGINRIIVGERRNFAGAEKFLRREGIEVVDLDLVECHEMMARFIREHPKLWNEDIGQ